MITLEKVRLVNWHFFDDVTIDIGESCLLAGDNGSGKSTIVDAIQYVMAADLRKAKFNAAAGERRSGRDLIGYVRCKQGSDTTEYLRGDAVAHIMLEFSNGKDGFSAGACVEAFTDGRLTEHFWVGDGISVQSVEVQGEGGIPLNFRQFDGILKSRRIISFEQKSTYSRELTNRLGVYRRRAEFNPYLDAFTRSVSFTPLVSVDKFVSDYILEERDVEIGAMKANLEAYKEADREAKAAIVRIAALKKIRDKADEWFNHQTSILKQEYLKSRLQKDSEEQKKIALEKKILELESKKTFIEKEIASLEKLSFELNLEKQETDTALALNDAHLLYRRLEEKIKRLEIELDEQEKKVAEYNLHKGQCESLLSRPLNGNLENELVCIEESAEQSRTEKENAARKKTELKENLAEVEAEYADLKRGVARYPDGPTRLKIELENAGLHADFLADITDITSPDWADAIEGWLNTLRFALLVKPEEFQAALEIYDSLPRNLAGAFLPNLEKMRGAKTKTGSLAELLSTKSAYARMYLDYILGDVMCADIKDLKTFTRAVTRECMTYSNHTASRIKEDVYKRHFLGQESRKNRLEFLSAEAVRLRDEIAEVEITEQRAREKEDMYKRVARTIYHLIELFPALEKEKNITLQKDAAQNELESVDTASFEELQNKKDVLVNRILQCDTDRMDNNRMLGENESAIKSVKGNLEIAESACEIFLNALNAFCEEHIENISACEAYYTDRLRQSTPAEILNNFDAAFKGIVTRMDNAEKDYHSLVQQYDRDFNALLSIEITENAEAKDLLSRLETSELPEYQEKISRARRDAEKEFKDHFISRLNELIEEARESFHEINETLRKLIFGRDKYSFSLTEREDRRGQIEIVKKAAEIPSLDDETSLFGQITDKKELQAIQTLFDNILNTNLDSPEMRSICDYRTYFNYDIKIDDTELIEKTGESSRLSLSKVLREKSGGEVQTPYYVAIAASFYRFFKNDPENTVRLVMFDEAFNRMDDVRIGKILEFFRQLNIQIIVSAPTEKIEAINPHMSRTNIVIRHAQSTGVYDFHRLKK